MAENLVKTQLYSHEGNANTPLAPNTLADAVAMNDVNGGASTVEAEIVALRQAVEAVVGKGQHFRGVVNSTSGLPTVNYKAGWLYSVQEAGTYAGNVCEVGDLIICIKDYASGSAANSDWAVLQANLDGAVTGPSASVAAHVVVFDGTSGKRIKDSGFTIAANVPANAKFTDTTYNAATDSADGLLTAALHKKLVGIETGADKTDADNVKAAGAFMTATNTADDIADGTTKVVMTAAERTKLTGIATGAEVNQNAFAKVKVGTTTLTATAKQDTLEIEAGEGVTITASGKKVTIKETYVDSCVVSSLDNVPANLRNGGLVILKS
jgi:hypothetical protein|uniref:Uncharacterized protein n=1 Tax=Podoviridae sp. ct9P15 TaxID=2826543 RepID=A0A8S5MF39_9CAUD|nr:MAG TPA: hypothetical protein [Podoviridae sp. ct9P15]